MSEQLYQRLIQLRDNRRKEVIPEPSFKQGVMWPMFAVGTADPVEEMMKGVEEWTRIAMATIISAGESIGMANYIDHLDKYQRQSNASRAAELKEQFNIEGTSPASCVNLMVAWAKGDLFQWHRHPIVSEHNLFGIGTYCPQVRAAEEMELMHKAQDLRLWCDAYDMLIAGAFNQDVRMIHANCPCSGDNYCLFYIFEEERNKKLKYSEHVLKGNAKKREELGPNYEPDYFEGVAMPRYVEGMDPAAIFKDGIKAKSGIAIESMLVAVKVLGMKKWLDICERDHSRGYTQTAIKLKVEHDRVGNDVRDAANLVAINMARTGYDGHNIIKYDGESIETVSSQCPIVDAANRLGLNDVLGDMSLWCDFYHSHFVHASNKKYDATFTHCLGRGDKYCRCTIK